MRRSRSQLRLRDQALCCTLGTQTFCMVHHSSHSRGGMWTDILVDNCAEECCASASALCLSPSTFKSEKGQSFRPAKIHNVSDRLWLEDCRRMGHLIHWLGEGPLLRALNFHFGDFLLKQGNTRTHPLRARAKIPFLLARLGL